MKKVACIVAVVIVFIAASFVFAQRDIDGSQQNAAVDASQYTPSMVHPYGYMSQSGCESSYVIVNEFGGEDRLREMQKLERAHPCSYSQFMRIGPGRPFFNIALYLLIFALGAIAIGGKSFLETVPSELNVVENVKKKPFLTPLMFIWLVWLIFTGCYVSLNLLGYPLEQSSMKYEIISEHDGIIRHGDFLELSFMEFAERHPTQAILTTTASTIGVFVPYGLESSLLFVFSPVLSVLALAFFISMMWMSGRIIQRYGTSMSKKIIIALVSLIVITLVVDIVRGTPFISWYIFLHAGTPHYCC